MKNGWKQKQIGDLCEVIAGQSPEGKFYNAENNGMPFYQGKKDFGEKFIEAPTVWTTQTTKVAQKGDILMSVRAPVGPVNFATEEACIGRGLAAIRAGTELNRDFLFYQLLHLQPEIAGKEGAVFASINKSEIEALPLMFAPFPEQKRIVGTLDEAFEGIATAKANAEKNLQNARALFETHLQSIFAHRSNGWKLKPLASLCKLISGQHIDAKDYNVEQKGVGYLTGPSDFGVVSPVVTKWTEHPKRMAKRGDILVTVKGSGVGKINLLDVDDVAISRQLMAVRATPADVSYLYAFLSTNFAYFQSLSKGAAIPGISRGDVLDLMCPMPPPEEQQSIVSLIHSVAEETQRLGSIYGRKLAALEALKNSILHRAFTGQL
jgi:type I restriction enzyme S subunit